MDNIRPQKVVDLSLLDPNPLNPNEMTPRQFNLLVDNVQRTGLTDPILVRQVGDRYRIVGGHHRYKAADYLGFKKVSITLMEDSFTEDEENFQLMRHNMIRGKLNTGKFMDLYKKMSESYSQEVLAESFGFEEESMLVKLVSQTMKTLPEELKEKFKEGAKEVKTIEGLGVLLNKLFSTYGETLPYGYMFLEFGSKESVWLRMQTYDLANFRIAADLCRQQSVSVDGLFRIFLQSIAKGDLPEIVAALASLPKIEVSAEQLPIEELSKYLDD
jgi:ParB/RepB/Spo0J family partition protein